MNPIETDLQRSMVALAARDAVARKDDDEVERP